MIADVTAGVVDHERERQLDQREAGLIRDVRQFLDGLQLALVLA